MSEESLVTQDQHRAHFAELRGEFTEEITSLRHDIAVLSKTVEPLTQTMTAGFVDLRQDMTQLRQESTCLSY